MVICDRIISRFWANVAKSDGCWLWNGPRHPSGYGQVAVPRSYATGKKISAHRVAWMIEHGEIPDGLMVCHHCDNPPCVRADHLFLGTNSDNLDDMTRKGRRVVGVRHYDAKLSEDQVRSIRSRMASESFAAIARDLGVSRSIASKAGLGRTYRSVV